MKSCEMWNKSKIILGCAEKKIVTRRGIQGGGRGGKGAGEGRKGGRREKGEGEKEGG